MGNPIPQDPSPVNAPKKEAIRANLSTAEDLSQELNKISSDLMRSLIDMRHEGAKGLIDCDPAEMSVADRVNRLKYELEEVRCTLLTVAESI